MLIVWRIYPVVRTIIFENAKRDRIKRVKIQFFLKNPNVMPRKYFYSVLE